LNYIASVVPVQLIQPTGGNFFNVHDYKYFETKPSGRFLYGLINKGETERHLDGNLNDVEYDPIEKTWYGDVGSQFPKQWNEDDGEPLCDVWPTTPNLPIQFWYNAAESLQFQFDDPYFEETNSIITDIPILTAQVNNTYTIQVVGNDLLETEGWYFSVNNSSYSFTTDTIQTRSFTTNQTVSVTVQGTGGYTYTSTIDLTYVEPEYVLRITPTGGNLYGTYDFLYSSTTPSGNYIYSLVNKDTENKAVVISLISHIIQLIKRSTMLATIYPLNTPLVIRLLNRSQRQPTWKYIGFMIMMMCWCLCLTIRIM